MISVLTKERDQHTKMNIIKKPGRNEDHAGNRTGLRETERKGERE